jgi:hypothetical protein
MPHITLNSDDPGIRGLLRYRPEIAGPMSGLNEVLLRGPNTLTRGERELIAVHATDLEIHDTVLIAAAFAMMNRYVDGLATIAPDDPAVYAAGAQRLVNEGYLPPPREPHPPAPAPAQDA